jgi:membrane-bound ClpP family serine protease
MGDGIMRPNMVAASLILLGAACVVTAVVLLAGYPWAIGVVGALAIVIGVLLYDPHPTKPPVYPNNRGVR